MTCVESVDTGSKIERHYVLAFSRRTPGIPRLSRNAFYSSSGPQGPIDWPRYGMSPGAK